LLWPGFAPPRSAMVWPGLLRLVLLCACLALASPYCMLVVVWLGLLHCHGLAWPPPCSALCLPCFGLALPRACRGLAWPAPPHSAMCLLYFGLACAPWPCAFRGLAWPALFSAMRLSCFGLACPALLCPVLALLWPGLVLPRLALPYVCLGHAGSALLCPVLALPWPAVPRLIVRCSIDVRWMLDRCSILDSALARGGVLGCGGSIGILHTWKGIHGGSCVCCWLFFTKTSELRKILMCTSEH
jgi:hypothetical protein